MMSIRKSPERYTFQKNSYIKNREEEGRTPDNDEEVKKMIDAYDYWSIQADDMESDPEWKIDNLEYDLRSTPWMAEKCKDDLYAQHLYAALCNNDFIKNDVWPILQDKRWGCSWRHAGGIVADIREQGDYIDWYCSSMRNQIDPEEFDLLNEEQKNKYKKTMAHVREGVVTDEIRKDLFDLGWNIIEEDSQE
jgi:hypothetical protein